MGVALVAAAICSGDWHPMWRMARPLPRAARSGMGTPPDQVQRLAYHQVPAAAAGGLVMYIWFAVMLSCMRSSQFVVVEFS
mmetsp:Transcript_31293/g.79803  ORF Transcript_31293/g.79803 Transcript_31293/m.79803 type:complete len:81 (+) Transcript_31293:1593-1835(+)